jgi:class 3 adenylate cyclase
VNLASRLQDAAEPSQALVSEATADHLDDACEFGPTRIIDLKGKGPTRARVLLGRRADVPIPVESAQGS